jgi:hypothetical protein
MWNSIVLLAAIAAFSTGAAAQDTPAPMVADFVGTWNIEIMSHQVALVIEPGEGNHVTATMMMMGNDVPLKGELIGRTLTLVGLKPADAAPSAEAGPSHAGSPSRGARPLTATMQDDGTLAGEMMTSNGPAKWTAEKLKRRKS